MSIPPVFVKMTNIESHYKITYNLHQLFLKKQKRELEEFNGEDQGALETFKDNQREEMEQKEIAF